MVRNLFLIILILTFICPYTFAQETRAFLKDGRVVIETPQGAKAVDFSLERGQRVYQLKNWKVKEEVNLAEEALKVYERKSGDVNLYNKEVWIYSSEDEANNVYVDFVTNKYNQDLIFSPDESYVYYMEYSPSGTQSVYGVNLSNEENFFVGVGNSFYTQTCGNDDTSTNYVVITNNDQGQEQYSVYNLDGSQVPSIGTINSIDDLSEVICY